MAADDLVPVPSKRRDLSFEEIARWASDDSHLLEREALRAVREVVEQGSVKLKIGALAVARNQLMQIQKLSELLDGDDGLQALMFRNVDKLNHRERMELFRIATQRESRAVSAFYANVASDKTMPDPDDLRAALEVPGRLDHEDAELHRRTERDVLVKLTQLAEVVHAKEVGLVSDPPVVT